jgi:hypothetical protein
MLAACKELEAGYQHLLLPRLLGDYARSVIYTFQALWFNARVVLARATASRLGCGCQAAMLVFCEGVPDAVAVCWL